MNKQEIERAKTNFKKELDEEMKHYTMYNDYTQKKIEDHKILWSYILELEKKVRAED